MIDIAGRNAQGAGTIRKKTVMRNGQAYTYWEARLTIGSDPGTGKQIQKSFSGKTQKEVREKLQAAAVAVNDSTYLEPSKITFGEWLKIWQDEYIGDVKPLTVAAYKQSIRLYLTPNLGAIKLQSLTAVDIQKVYNKLTKGEKPLSAKTIKNLHGVCHRALQQAVEIGYIRFNPSDACKLPRVEKHEMKPLDDEKIQAFMKTVSGHKYEYIYLVTLFTGMREGEVLGLTWDCVDFDSNSILINRQLQKMRDGSGYVLASTKSDKARRITAAPFVMNILKKQQEKQNSEKKTAQDMWSNEWDLVFTNGLGEHLCAVTVYNCFKRICRDAGFEYTRFHDLRHSYAVAALRAGDDIKTVQSNLGHATASFTLDVYGHCTDQMKLESANRMERFISSLG